MFLICVTIWKLLDYPKTHQKIRISQKEKQNRPKGQNHINLNEILHRKRNSDSVLTAYHYLHNWGTWFIISVFSLCSSHVLQQTCVTFPHHDISLSNPIRQIVRLRGCAECRVAPYDPSAMPEVWGAGEGDRSVLLGKVSTRLLIGFRLTETFRYSKDSPGTNFGAHNVGSDKKRQQNKMWLPKVLWLALTASQILHWTHGVLAVKSPINKYKRNTFITIFDVNT